eukprot:815814-Alexandrium_andersonii.AAC.1
MANACRAGLRPPAPRRKKKALEAVLGGLKRLLAARKRPSFPGAIARSLGCLGRTGKHLAG